MLSYSLIVPQNILSDSATNGKMNGFNFGFYLLSKDLTAKSKFSSLLFGAGFNTGRLKIKSEGFRPQKNPFFTPAIFFNPRMYINRFTISVRAEYQFDISKKGWRSLSFTNETENYTLNPSDNPH